MTTKTPVTLSGWYENTDGTWTEFRWSQGRLVEAQTAVAPETSEERNARYAADDRASRKGV